MKIQIFWEAAEAGSSSFWFFYSKENGPDFSKVLREFPCRGKLLVSGKYPVPKRIEHAIRAAAEHEVGWHEEEWEEFLAECPFCSGESWPRFLEEEEKKLSDEIIFS